MSQRKTLVVILVSLGCAFAGGFILRPIIMSPTSKMAVVRQAPGSVVVGQARGTQYFEANIEEARQVVAACRDGTVRGDECANAETAVITVESKQRFRRFREDR